MSLATARTWADVTKNLVVDLYEITTSSFAVLGHHASIFHNARTIAEYNAAKRTIDNAFIDIINQAGRVPYVTLTLCLLLFIIGGSLLVRPVAEFFMGPWAMVKRFAWAIVYSVEGWAMWHLAMCPFVFHVFYLTFALAVSYQGFVLPFEEYTVYWTVVHSLSIAFGVASRTSVLYVVWHYRLGRWVLLPLVVAYEVYSTWTFHSQVEWIFKLGLEDVVVLAIDIGYRLDEIWWPISWIRQGGEMMGWFDHDDGFWAE